MEEKGDTSQKNIDRKLQMGAGVDKMLVPSLLSADFYQLEGEIRSLERAGVTHLHLDIMDGSFVPNITFGPGLISAIRPYTDMCFDCHLMVNEPDHLFADFARAGVQMLTVHQEATRHLHRSIQNIHSLGMKAGVSLNPATPLSVLEYVMEEVDLILIMSVNPGFGGQRFIPQMISKIEKAKQMIEKARRDIILEVDGGIKLSNLEQVMEAGCDWVVAGSAVFERGKTEQNAREFLAEMKKYSEK